MLGAWSIESSTAFMPTGAVLGATAVAVGVEVESRNAVKAHPVSIANLGGGSGRLGGAAKMGGVGGVGAVAGVGAVKLAYTVHCCEKKDLAKVKSCPHFQAFKINAANMTACVNVLRYLFSWKHNSICKVPSLR